MRKTMLLSWLRRFLVLTAYGVIFFMSFYHYSLGRTHEFRAFGTTLHNVLFAAAFTAATFFPAWIVILYSLVSKTSPTGVRIGGRVGVVVLATLGSFFLRRSHTTLNLAYPLYLIEIAVIICHVEINRHLKTVKSKAILACVTGGLGFAAFAVPFLLASVRWPNAADREVLGYLCIFVFLMLMRTCPQIFASAFLVGRKIPQPARGRHAIAGCCLFLCGCAACETWIAADEARYTRQLNEWKAQHTFLTPSEKEAIEAELKTIERQRDSEKWAPNPELQARSSTLHTLQFRDHFGRKRVWPNRDITIMYWVNGEIHNSPY